MSKIYQLNIIEKKKESLRKKARERYQNLSKEKIGNMENMIVNVTKISGKMKNRCLLSIESKKKKKLYYDYKKVF